MKLRLPSICTTVTTLGPPRLKGTGSAASDQSTGIPTCRPLIYIQSRVPAFSRHVHLGCHEIKAFHPSSDLIFTRTPSHVVLLAQYYAASQTASNVSSLWLGTYNSRGAPLLFLLHTLPIWHGKSIIKRGFLTACSNIHMPQLIHRWPQHNTAYNAFVLTWAQCECTQFSPVGTNHSGW